MPLYDLAVIDAALHGTLFAGKLHHFPTIHSTNTHALDDAQSGAPTGSVYVAEEQTAGRGRGGHAWHSIPGEGMYVSILLRPRLAPVAALKISLATGLAVQAAILETAGLHTDIRWPNDILLRGRKCGGILVETAATGAELRHVVIGIGINANHRAFPPELGAIATSLRLESGEEQAPQPLLLAVLRHLEREMRLLETGADLLARFAESSTWARGKYVHVDEAGGYTGYTNGLDSHGFLKIRTADGSERLVLSGGVREVDR